MGDVDDELDQRHGQGADELEGPEVDGEQDVQADLRGHDQYLAGLIKQGEEAGYGRQTEKLRTIRKVLAKSRQHIAAAEERGKQQALAEFANGDGGQAVQAIRAQVQAELAEQTSRERSLARLGLPADSPLRALFSDVRGDHREYEKRADALRSQGIQWGGDPVGAAARRCAAPGGAAGRHAGPGERRTGRPLPR